ncbi:MAG TPA: SAM-dependent methyltransferase [Pseudonocardiaceae bacterium]|nr:SAM-dependent methyltransferase [Pseudonocardiaceae bacterium]
MAERPDWVPEGVEIDVPNVARMYDYMLGGYHNFAVDRENAERLEAVAPGATAILRANRAFVGRSVRWLVDAGIRQFLDIGSGIPTLGNVHEIAQDIAPESRVVYVDIDPIAVAHSKAILAGNPFAGALRADLTKPAEILRDPHVTGLLDFAQPVAVLLNAVLHFVSDEDDPAGILDQLRSVMIGGSYLTITHGTFLEDWTDTQLEAGEVLSRTPTAMHLRDRDQLAAMLSGMELIEPGIVPVNDWHPDTAVVDDDDAPRPAVLAVVARQR